MCYGHLNEGIKILAKQILDNLVLLLGEFNKLRYASDYVCPLLLEQIEKCQCLSLSKKSTRGSRN